MKALIIGATGATGKDLLVVLLDSPHIPKKKLPWFVHL